MKKGVVSCTIGTSGVVFASCDDVKIDPQNRLHTFCHAVPDKWYVMGVMLSAGGSLRWFRDALGDQEVRVGKSCGMDPYDLLSREAMQAEPGCEGLILLPYLMGERTPYPDPNARGVFFGLTLRHKKNQLVRAVMEGVAYGVKDSLGRLKEAGIEVEQVRVSGGGARSPVWRQIQADVCGVGVLTTEVDEGPAFGAALLAGVGVGVHESVERACEEAVKIVSKTMPVPENVNTYGEYYKIYRPLYGALKPDFDRVSEILGRH